MSNLKHRRNTTETKVRGGVNNPSLDMHSLTHCADPLCGLWTDARACTGLCGRTSHAISRYPRTNCVARSWLTGHLYVLPLLNGGWQLPAGAATLMPVDAATSSAVVATTATAVVGFVILGGVVAGWHTGVTTHRQQRRWTASARHSLGGLAVA